MRREGRNRLSPERIRLLTRCCLASLLTFIFLFWVAFEGFFVDFPIHPNRQPYVPWLLLLGPGFCFLLKQLRKLEPLDPEFANFSQKILNSGERAIQLFLSKAFYLRFALLTVLLVYLLIWIPEFLLQPIWTDHEHVIAMARLWNQGQFPWLAMHTYQFPGEMELAWAAVTLFGWNNLHPYFLMELVIIGLLSLVMLAWSARQLGHWGYGLGAILSLVLLMSSLPFTNVAQRDTHATICTLIAFCFPGLFSRAKLGDGLSALFFAFGLAIRPHVILFLPVVLCGIWWSNSNLSLCCEQKSRNLIRRFLFWIFAVGIFGLFFMEPVLGPWRTREFLAALEFPFQQKGVYRRGPFNMWQAGAKDYYRVSRHFWYLGLCLFMVLFSSDASWKKRGIVMFLIGLTAGVYRMAHPFDHGYLRLPLQISECLGMAVFPAWLVANTHSIRSWSWFAVAGLMLHTAEPEWPLYVDLNYVPTAYQAIISGRAPDKSPPGSSNAYPPDAVYHYSWNNWLRLMDWFRLETSPNTPVLNLLSYSPFPPVLGSIDRPQLGRLESIVLLNWFKHYDFDSEIVNNLKNAPTGTLVVWDSWRTNLENVGQIPKSSETIRRLFQKRIDFGEIEVWEKMPD